MAQKELLLENQLCHPLYSASNALQRVYKKLLQPLDVTYPQYLILMSLWDKEGVNIQTLCEATYFDSGTLTPLLQKLVGKKLIEMKALPQDRRNKLVFLTKKGRDLQKKAVEVPGALSCIMPFNASEFGAFKLQVEKLYKALLAHESESKS